MVERDQQRHIARNNLRQHPHGGADLRSSAFVGQQAGQDFFSDGLFCAIENAVSTALCDAS
jgi:hypothetical protein